MDLFWSESVGYLPFRTGNGRKFCSNSGSATKEDRRRKLQNKKLKVSCNN